MNRLSPRLALRGLLLLGLGIPRLLPAQGTRTLTRASAISEALRNSPRLAGARADTALAYGGWLTARSIPNPTLGATYTKDAPKFHITAEFPIDLPWLRGDRVGAANAGRDAARLQYAWAVVSIELDADTTYTLALAAVARAELSHRNAIAFDSLYRIAVARRDAGDVSTLEVELASISSGQQANAAATDSLAAISAIMQVQAVLGMSTRDVLIALGDSLAQVRGGFDIASRGETPLQVASAAAQLRAAEQSHRLQQRSSFAWPSVILGFDTGNPSGEAQGLLPVVGFSVPLPLWNRNRGPIAEAAAQRDRARAELMMAERESEMTMRSAERDQLGARARLARDSVLRISAERVSAMSVTAYREGAAPLASVLEAQRTAREVQAQYIDDLTRAAIAASIIRTMMASRVPREEL